MWAPPLTPSPPVSSYSQDHAGSTADTSVLVKRDGDDSFTYVNFILSRHSGRWLIDSLSIV